MAAIDFRNAPAGNGLPRYPSHVFEAVRKSGRAVWNDAMNGWMVTNFRDIKKVYTDTKTFSNGEGGIRNAFGRDAMLFQDAAALHNRLRAIWAASLSVNGILEWQTVFETLAEQVVAPAVERMVHGETVELVSVFKDFAIDAITGLMDVPSNRREDFKRWNNIISDAAQIRLPPDDPKFIQRAAVKQEVFDFLAIAITDRNKRLDAGEQPADLVTMMVKASRNNAITDAVVADNLLNLFLGAYDTTVRWLSNILVVLKRFPAALETLVAHPEQAGQAYDEVLRFEGVVQLVTRTVNTDDGFIGDQKVEKGQDVILMLGAGNRDPERFDHANCFDIQRTGEHLGFGFGIHQCLGMHAARGEARAVFATLLPYLAKLEIVSLDYGDNWALWGPVKLEARIPPAR